MKLWNLFISLSLFCLTNACVTDEENLANKQVSSPKLDIKKMGTMITRILDKHKEKGELLAYRACPPTKNYKAVEIKSVWSKPTAVIAFYHNNDHVEFKKSIGREGVQAKAKHSIDIITFNLKPIYFNPIDISINFIIRSNNYTIRRTRCINYCP